MACDKAGAGVIVSRSGFRFPVQSFESLTQTAISISFQSNADDVMHLSNEQLV